MTILNLDDSLQWLAWEGARRAWLESKRDLSGSENTVIAYEIAFRQFLEWSPVPLWQVSPHIAQEWRNHLEKQDLAPSTIAFKLSVMSSFYEFVRREMI